MNGTRTNGSHGTKTVNRCSSSFWIVLLVLSNLLAYQLAHLQLQQRQYGFFLPYGDSDSNTLPMNGLNSQNHLLWSLPQGTAQALPSIRVSPEEQQKLDRKVYGGVGDGKHLGGFTNIDIHGISPATWKFMITYFGIKSIVDVGCGRGISTTWFITHGVDALCVEGSHDALSKTMLPDPPSQMIEHDFSRGPWWPSKTYDAVWCVEFLEHVGRNYHHHYLPTFRKAALLFVTHSKWGGWHHVEVHDQDWWIYKFESYGFRYSESLTNRIRKVAADEYRVSIDQPQNASKAPNGVYYNAQHIWLTMMVFVNPLVASLPQHAHLFAEPGCFVRRINAKLVARRCGEGGSPKQRELETPLPPQFNPLELNSQMDLEWEELVRHHPPIKNRTAAA